MLENIELTELVENPFGEKYFKEINNLSFEKLSSDSVFNLHYVELLEPEEFLYIVIGTDSGLLYRFIKEQELKKNIHFIFIDFKEVIEKAGLVEEEVEHPNPQVKLAYDNFSFQEISDDLYHLIIRRKINLIKSLAVLDAEPGSPYAQLWEKFEVAFNAFRRSEFNAQSTKVFEEERILNIADNMTPVSKLGGCLAGKDVVVLGGGPTLDDSIDWIRENQDRLVIFAAARISKRLSKESIIPDFFVTVDPFDWSFDNSKGVMAFANDSVLVHSFHAQHKLVSQWNGLSVYAGNKYGFKVPNRKSNIDMPGPTVTNAALHVACSLGADRVFLSGVDFCFARGLTHESGSEEVKMSDTFGHSGKAKVLDNSGNWTETGDDFYSAMYAMQAAVKIYLRAKPNLEFYSLGLHSAKMENVNYIDHKTLDLRPFDKVVFTLENRDKLKVEPKEQVQIVKQDIKFLSEQLKRFKSLKSLSADGEKATDKLYDKKTEQQSVKNSEKVKRLRKKIDALVGDDGDMLLNYQAAFFYNSFKPVDETVEMTHEEIVEQLTAYFSGINKVSEHFIDALTKGLERAKLRSDELSGKVLPSKLTQKWHKWHEFGRAEQWFTWHSDIVLSAQEELALTEARTNYKEELEKEDHNYKSRVQKRVSDVAVLFARADLAFNQKNIQEITAIIEHSESLESDKPEQKASLVAMLKAMRSELLEEFPEAIRLYEEVNTPLILRQKALKGQLNLYMNDHQYEQTLLTLEKLCEFSLDYMVPYAEMLALLNNKELAIQVLNLYLNEHQDNLNAQNKYAQLLVDVGETQVAAQVVALVLEKDPNNKTAQHLSALLS